MELQRAVLSVLGRDTPEGIREDTLAPWAMSQAAARSAICPLTSTSSVGVSCLSSPAALIRVFGLAGCAGCGWAG